MLVATAVAAAVAAVLQGGGATLTVLAIGAATFLAAVAPTALEALRERLEASESSRAEENARVTRLNELLRGDWPLRLADASPVKHLGVHWSNKVASYATHGGLPAYIRRDIDDQVRDAVLSEQMVMLRGQSLAGKTRTMYEAARRAFADDDLVIVPKRPRDRGSSLEVLFGDLDVLRGAAGHRAILWLDDIDEFIRAGVIDVDFMDRLEDASVPVTVLGTIRESEYDALLEYAGVPGEAVSDRSRRGLRLLSRARVISLAAVPTDEEADRAGDLYPDEDFSQGVGAQLIDAELLIDRFEASRTTHPGCYAIVRAAVDWHLTGMVAGITREQLFGLARSDSYRDQLPPGTILGTDELAHGLSRAMKPLDSGVSMLRALDDEMTMFTPFDYLLDIAVAAASAAHPGAIVADDVWCRVLEYADRDEAFYLGYNAYWGSNPRVAEIALRRAAKDGDNVVEATQLLACVLRDTGRPAEGRDILEAQLSELRARDDADARQVASCEIVLSSLLKSEGNWNRAKDLAQSAVALLADLAEAPAVAMYAEALCMLSVMLVELDDATAGRAIAERAVALASRPDFPTDLHPLASSQARTARGTAARELNDLDAADADLREALEEARTLLGPSHMVVGNVLMMVATVAWRRGNAKDAVGVADTAIAALEGYFGEDHTALVDSVGTRGGMRLDSDDPQGAVRDLDRALAMSERWLPEAHQLPLRFLGFRAVARFRMDDATGASADAERAMAMADALYGTRDPRAVTAVAGLGWQLRRVGDRADAAAAFERALGSEASRPLHNTPELGSVAYALAGIRALDGATDQAIALYKQAVDAHVASPNAWLTHALFQLGLAYQTASDLAGAEGAMSQALDAVEYLEPEAQPDFRADALSHLGDIRLLRGDFEGARSALDDSWQLVVAAGRADEHRAAWLLLRLGEARLVLGEPARAAFEHAMRIERGAHGLQHPAVARALRGLALTCFSEGDPIAAKRLLELCLEASDAVSRTPDVQAVLDDLQELDDAGPVGSSPFEGSPDDHGVIIGRLRRRILDHRDMSDAIRARASKDELDRLAELEKRYGAEHARERERQLLLDHARSKARAYREGRAHGDSDPDGFDAYYDAIWRETIRSLITEA